jgi:O-antigen/teichoic acid export membrane protein
MVVAPRIAHLHAQGDARQLQRLVTVSARAAVLMAFPATIILAMFGGILLKFVVGEGYALAATPLVVLGLGQLLGSYMGSGALILNMTNNERAVAVGLGVAAVGNMIGNLVFIPIWGMQGAALATSITTVAWSTILARESARRLGLNSLAFGRIYI